MPVGPTVLALGITSLVSDVSSEMVTSILPAYLVLHLQYSPLVFGTVDGLYQGGAAFARAAGGVLADRVGRYRDVAAAGYAISALSRLGLLLAGRSVPGLVAVVALDRVGKGIRTAPRDALLSLSAPRGHVAAAFGVHRALDTAGATLGPLAAVGLLAWMPGAYDVVFVASFAIGVIGVGVLLLFVRDEPRPLDGASPARGWRGLARTMDASQIRLITVAALFGLVTIGDGLLYLVLQRTLAFPEQYLPLLFVATPAVYLVLAVPAGRLADRAGRARVVVVGYGCLLMAYVTALIGGPAWPTLGLAVLLLGAYYAGTDGVLMALASGVVPVHARATGLGLITTANGLARFIASIGFGWVWARVSVQAAIATYAAALVLVLVVAAPMLFSRAREEADHVA